MSIGNEARKRYSWLFVLLDLIDLVPVAFSRFSFARPGGEDGWMPD